MSDSAVSPVLAIDGGGTHCRITLAGEGPPVSVETGAANVSTDFEGGVREILAGLHALRARTGLTEDAITALPAFVGLAGVVGPAIAARLRAALPFARVRIDDDRPAALRGALGGRDGVIAHCGTGSFYGAQVGGAMRFAGGWGAILGDEASAVWVGRSALATTLRAADGRLPMSPMAERVLAEMDGTAGIVAFAGRARPQDFGALAPVVTAAADAGDTLAVRIMRDAADDIARSLPLIGWVSGMPVCLTGGIGPRFAAYLPGEIRADLTAPEGEPLAGAIALARALAAGEGR